MSPSADTASKLFEIEIKKIFNSSFENLLIVCLKIKKQLNNHYNKVLFNIVFNAISPDIICFFR